MKNPDFNLSVQIRLRYNELVDEMKGLDSDEAFSKSGPIRKAIIFDFLQIGE